MLRHCMPLRPLQVSRLRVFSRFQSHGFTQKLHPHPTVPEPFAYSQSKPQNPDDIFVAMSSGVDSSVTAALLSAKHKNVKGIYMANWSQSAKCTEEEWTTVQKVCDQLNIPCERVNFEKEYWADVFMPMIEMYEKGLTPNPDLGCNKFIKFGKMIEHLAAKYEGIERKWWLATGHYARVEKAENQFNLVRAYDGNKDQSYYLSSIPSAVLPRLLLPLGHFTKVQVRKMAAELGLHTASRPDSQGLCFVSPDHTKFRHFLDEFIPPKPGNIVTEDGKVWGKHSGIWHATIGQRSGISMPQGDSRYTGVWFVSEKRKETNEIVIVKGGANESLFSNKLRASEWEWLNELKPGDLENITFQYRSLQDPIEIEQLDIDGDDIIITTKAKQRAMAPGQSVVVYKGNRVLGSGVLAETYK